MDRIFFSSTYFGENGPNEVNRNLVENFPQGSVSYLHCKNRYFIRLETLLKILWCRVLIISGLGQKDYEVRFAKVLGKKIIYIMHGFAEDDSEYLKARQDFLFPRADLILCVSELFREQVKAKYPELTGKLSVLNNGIAWEKITATIANIQVPRDANEIALIGGGRLIKKNLNVCKAVQKLNNDRGLNLHISVYGPYAEDDESREISEMECVTFVGLVPHSQLLERLCSSNLMVQASSLEPFGLSVIESLICGCNLVVSKNVGAIGVIPAITSFEIINDSNNINEISERILFVINNPNNKRLLNSIDKGVTSLEAASGKLVNIANTI